MRCQFCGEEREDGDLGPVTIVEKEGGWGKPRFGKRKWTTVLVKKVYTVCKDRPCGGNLQMSREG